MMNTGLFLTALSGFIIGWTLRSLWVAWKARRLGVEGIEPGDTLMMVWADGKSETVTVSKVKRSRIILDDNDSKGDRV